MSQTLDEQAYAQYPKLRGLFNFIPSTGPQTDSRMSETYPADERDNPMPGKATIQQFNPAMTPDDFMGEALHILPNVDPYVGAMKRRFLQSMTPQQQRQLKDQYLHAVKNEGEQRPFDEWQDMSGHDAWFRGHITGQWPAEMYTPYQIQQFDNLKSYLQGK